MIKVIPGSCDNLLSVLHNDTQFNYLRMEDNTDNYLYYYLNDSVDRQSGITIEAYARLICDMEGDFDSLGIYIQDGTHCFIVSVCKDFVMVDYDNQQKSLGLKGACLRHQYGLYIV